MSNPSIGKARLDVTSRGCIDCGTQHSSAWHEARRVPVSIGNRRMTVLIHRCDRCEIAKATKQGQILAQRSVA